MKKNILVTGAAGFVGSFLCEELATHGYFVVGVDNFFRGKPENLGSLMVTAHTPQNSTSRPHDSFAGLSAGSRKPTIALDPMHKAQDVCEKSEQLPLMKDNFILEALDLSLPKNIEPLRKIILKYNLEVIFHLAAINGTQYFYDNPLFVLDKNIKCTQNLLAAIEGTPVNYLIYSSSSEVYGDPLVIPTNETHPIILNSISDRDSYAASKAVDDFYIRLYAKKHHLPCLILRIFNLYGERMIGTQYGQVIPEFINRILFEDQFTIIGDGTQTRSFCYIKDATWAMRELLEKNITGIINLGNNEEITILALAKLIHRLENLPFNPKFLPSRPHDHKRRQPDIHRLWSLLPELTFTSLECGLRKIIDYYKRK